MKSKKSNLKKYLIAMLIIDVIAVLNLGLQIYLKDISYPSYLVLILSNIIVFITYKRSK